MSDEAPGITPEDFPPPALLPANPDYVPAYVERPAAWMYDIDQANGISRATYWGEVCVGGQGSNFEVATKGDIAASTTGVSSFNTRTGAVTLTLADITAAGGAPSNNPTFVGNANYATQPPGTNSTLLATCQFVQAAIGAAAGVSSFNGRQGAVTLTLGDVTSIGGAPLASPVLTGNPTGPTPGTGDASGSLATTQFVQNTIASGAVVSWNGRKGNVTLSLSDITSAGGAPIASPALTGVPTVPTASPGTATSQAASTAFVTNAVVAAAAGVSSFNSRTGAVTLTLADVEGAGGAPSVSPNLTGSPTAPTQSAGVSNTTLATTAFVANAISGLPGVSSFNGRQGAVSLQLADVTSVGGAPIASPNFSGSPTTTTPPPGDNSTRVADTAFVATSFAPLASPALTGTPTVPTASPGTNTGQAASTQFVENAITTATGVVQEAAFDNTGRNFIHNSLYNVWQRGGGPFSTTNAYSADRWAIFLSGDTIAVNALALTDAQRTQIGDEAARLCYYANVTGGSAAGNFTQIGQPIEHVTRLSGKTVILSFWASTNTAGFQLGLRFSQSFGSGGSPSASINGPAQTVTLSGNLTRYALVFNIGSASGKTLGTNGDDATSLLIGFSSGSTNSALIGVGVQSGAVALWGVQCEIAQPGVTQPTPLEHPDPQVELAKCMRFFQLGYFDIVGDWSLNNWKGYAVPLSLMRGNPTIIISSPSQTGIVCDLSSYGYARFVWQATSSSSGHIAGNFTASADL